MTGGAVTAWAIEALLASAALIALVLMLRVPVRRAFGPQVAYALWALPLLRLVLPPLPDDWGRATPAPLAAAGERLATLILPQPLPEAEPSLLGPALVLVWSVGGAMFLLWHLCAYLRFARRVAASGTTLGRVGRIALVVSDHVSGPLAFGIARPVVAVPRDFRARYDAAERELALRHEVGHHRRGDVWANWAALACLALHWFNPLAWIAWRLFRSDQEMANDASVLSGRDPAERYAYACAMVRAGGGRVPAGACELHTVDDLKGRLRMLARTTSRGRRAAGAAVIAGTTLALLALTASGGSAAESVRASMEAATGVPLSALGPTALLQGRPDVPQPPAPPRPTAPGSRDRHVETRRTSATVHVTVTENGQTRHYAGADAEAWLAANPQPVPPPPPSSAVGPVPPVPANPPNAWNVPDDAARRAMRDVPQVVSRNCGLSGGATSITRTEGGRRTIVICADRIAAVEKTAADTELAALDQHRIAREAMTTALAGLRRTRAAMADGRSYEQLGTGERAAALASIDGAIADMERETAGRN